MLPCGPFRLLDQAPWISVGTQRQALSSKHAYRALGQKKDATPRRMRMFTCV